MTTLLTRTRFAALALMVLLILTAADNAVALFLAGLFSLLIGWMIVRRESLRPHHH